jgi:HK97 family phage major capsid protein
LWTPGIKTDARPATILDRPYVTAPDMPAIGAGLYPILFGDFRRAYMIIDRVVMEMMTDPFSSKATGQIEFSARRRVGGQVVLAEAIRKQKIAAS